MNDDIKQAMSHIGKISAQKRREKMGEEEYRAWMIENSRKGVEARKKNRG